MQELTGRVALIDKQLVKLAAAKLSSVADERQRHTLKHAVDATFVLRFSFGNVDRNDSRLRKCRDRIHADQGVIPL
jgi:hypothetical protein